ncbi:hypothetical protein BDR04DRAFT_1162674 [Suillus decipiens]|nr:hypothetical protein BDR04DRAFT_1162674 [Suillus decipiens]
MDQGTQIPSEKGVEYLVTGADVVALQGEYREESNSTLEAFEEACLLQVIDSWKLSTLTFFILSKAHYIFCLVDLKKDKRYSESYDRYIKCIEEGYLVVSSTESALVASRDLPHPHLAGAGEDFQDAKDILTLFQSEFGIPTPATEPIYPVGSPESREAALSTTSKLSKPAAWVDIYYPVMNTWNSDGMIVELLGESDQPI